MPLVFTDFDTEGLDVIVLGLVTAGVPESNGTVYRAPENGGPLGSLDMASDFVVQPGQSITWIRLVGTGGSPGIRLRDNPSAERWDTFFTANPGYSLRFQTEDAGPFILSRGNQDADFSTWMTSDAAAVAAIGSIGAGDMFFLAMAQPITVFESGMPSFSVDSPRFTPAPVRGPVTGPDGMNAPFTRADGVSSADWQELNARIFTEYRREPFMPDFAIGLKDALGNPSLSPIEIRRRITASLRDSYLDPDRVEVTVSGSHYRIETRLEAPDDAP